MPFLPDWAPNVHPVLVHFPIAWLIAAIVVDLLSLALPFAVALPGLARGRAALVPGGETAPLGESASTWAESAATFLYAAGALSTVIAYLSGLQAADTVFTPGLAHAVVEEHERWALATTVFFGVLTAVRLVFFVTNRRPRFASRAALAAVGAAGLILLFLTGDLGARLVYEFGVGVSADWMTVAPRE